SSSTGYNYYPYVFTTVNGPAPCIVPYGLSSSHVSTTSETVMWDNHVTGDSFLVRYTRIGTGVMLYKHLPTGSSSTTLTGLLANTDYQWWVKDYCGGTSTGYNSTPATFKTLASRIPNANINAAGLKWSIYPNPAREQLTV